MRPVSLASLLLVLLVGYTPRADAQARWDAVLHGVVVDDETSAPISSARVELLGERGRRTAATLTDADGMFVFRNIRHGPFALRVSRIGFRETTTPEWHLRHGDTLQVEVRLDTEAVLLAPLEIVAMSSARPSPVLEGLVARRRAGVGTFIDREDIERRRPATVTDLLATLPGIRVTSGGGRLRGGRNIEMARALPGRPGGCPVQVFLDGRLLTRSILDATGGLDADPAFSLDDTVSPADLHAVEVYRGLSTVPAEFLTPESRCGVVALWTRRGGPN